MGNKLEMNLQAARVVGLVEVLETIRRALDNYAFIARNEADLQEQVARILTEAGLVIDREVIAERGRYDILVRANGLAIVLELKVKSTAAEVERQAQRYALTGGNDAVVVVTTSQRLGAKLRGDMLGGVPFGVLTLRTAI